VIGGCRNRNVSPPNARVTRQSLLLSAVAHPLQLRQNGFNCFLDRSAYFLTERLTRFVALTYDPHEEHVLRARAEHFCCHEAFRQGRRMWIESFGWRNAKDVFFSVEHYRARNFVTGDRIHQNERSQAHDLMSKIQCRGAEVCDFYIFTEPVARLEKPHDKRSHAVVSKQDVADAADERSSHKIFATPIFRPEGSKA